MTVNVPPGKPNQCPDELQDPQEGEQSHPFTALGFAKIVVIAGYHASLPKTKSGRTVH